MTYEVELRKRIDLFEKQIETKLGLAKETPAEKRIYEAMTYALNAGGKRLRPILLLEIATHYDVPYETAYPFALALEMIHTYSLIHDDLPCMDDDALRRGKPTCHIKFGEAVAVLAGDGLLNYASEIMLEAIINQEFQRCGVLAMNAILKASGPSGMILGQVADMTYAEQNMRHIDLDYINHLKTGKLLTAALVAGALLGNAPKCDVEKFKKIGEDVGLMFQMVDDLLDIKGNSEKMGKETQMDQKNKKITYPVLMGILETETHISTLKETILRQIEDLRLKSDFLVETVKFLSVREY